ncbi:MAG TPA: YicC family protein [Cryomorphaceae bacterium]|nr:YicC family protein [Cryomorphaceae bacterium]|tara:strand:+ start:547 stop:1401 length:855 start_codon:yes stop_codon:yes gene_type:complete
MIQSMTGFGKAIGQTSGKKITVEIRSLNSKGLDLNARIAPIFREKELDIRKMIGAAVKRGKVDINIYVEVTGIESATSINMKLAKAYLEQLEVLGRETDSSGDLIATVMRMPDVMGGSKSELTNKEWSYLQGLIIEALEKLKSFRKQEGDSIAKDYEERLVSIEKSLTGIAPHEEARLGLVRERLMKVLEGVEVDSNRYEQEVIFYIEKLDINEEKVRLANHMKYFRETMQESNSGKKLGFIAQEMGREINTLGSKSNYAPMQQHVVQMKDELEKIKEQVGNTL